MLVAVFRLTIIQQLIPLKISKSAHQFTLRLTFSDEIVTEQTITTIDFY